jgi:hypothetical protein
MKVYIVCSWSENGDDESILDVEDVYLDKKKAEDIANNQYASFVMEREIKE